MAILIQTDRFGTSMGESLRTHSDFMRLRRKQEAEERAAKVGVKLVFPIFLFILPSMMIVAAGPAHVEAVPGSVPYDAELSANNERSFKTMDSTMIMQTVFWLATLGVLVLYVQRARKRKTNF